MERRHELAFALEINRAECEFLTGELEAAEQRLEALSKLASDTVERAAVACLHMDPCTTLGQNSRAVTIGLDYLRRVGVAWEAHPTKTAARREYDRIWTALGSRSIEDLIDLPLMADPAALATADVLIKLAPPALFTDPGLNCLVTCKVVNLSLEYGNGNASSFAYESLAMHAGLHFGDYEAGYRFGRLGCDLVERRGLARYLPAVFMIFGQMVVPWSHHIRDNGDLVRRGFEAANKIGDLTFAGFTCNNMVTNMLIAGDTRFERIEDVEEVLEESGIAIAPIPREALFLAAKIFQRYACRGEFV